MAARKPRPVITVVDAKPMSETGFRQEQKKVERPKPSPRDTSKSAVWSPSPSSPTDGSSVQIMPESKSAAKPEKPQRSFQVRYNPHSTEDATTVGSPTKAKRSLSPEDSTASTTRPVPRPRPKSMVVSRSEPLSIAVETNDVKKDKPQPSVHPQPAARPPVTKPVVLQPVASKGTKGYHVVGTSIWYDGDTKVPPQRPPPVKPKPVVSPTSSDAEKTVGPSESALAEIPPDIVRRKPTIIRPSQSMFVDQTVGSPASSVAVPPQAETTVTISTAVTSTAETNGWNKVASHAPQSASNVIDVAAVSEADKPQPKKRPTIIRMNRPGPSDTVSASEPPSDAADQKQSRRSPQNSVEVSRKSPSHDSESCTDAVSDLQRSADHVNPTAVGRQSISRETGSDDLKPVPRSQSQPVHSTEELERKVPPEKPPPPRASNAVEEEQKTSVENAVKDNCPKDKPPRPVSRPNQPPPARPAPPATHPGKAPELPERPSLGHPLYHYVVKGPHALALFDYTASHSDELSFTAGDVIMLKSWVNAEWIVGVTEKAQGMFPVNFVEIVEPLPSKPGTVSRRSSKETSHLHTLAQQMSGPRCVARFDYEATEPEDLGFTAGEVIRLKECVGDEWLSGELNGKTGVFPVAFVEIVEHLPSAAADSSDSSRSSPTSETVEHTEDDGHWYCIATYDFSGETAEDLSFKVGDRISLLKWINNEWLQGSLKGQEGMFPAAFVDIICDSENALPPRPKVQSTSISNQTSDNASQPSTSPTGVDRSLSSPVAAKRPASQSRSGPLSPGLQAVALYDFDGDTSLGDLVFQAGETIIDVRNVSEEWMSGRIGDRTGSFPTAFVQIS